MADKTNLQTIALAATAGVLIGVGVTIRAVRGGATPSVSDTPITYCPRRSGSRAQQVRESGPINSRTGGGHTGRPDIEGNGVDQGPEPGRSGQSTADAIESLSTKVLRARIIDVFPHGYLTLIAIIQGAVFGLLFITVQQRISVHLSDLGLITMLAQAMAVGAAIVVVTHQYLLLTMVLRWTPTTLDTLIPYLLGSGEMWLALTIGRSSSWSFGLSALCAAAIVAFRHTLSRTSEGIFLNKEEVYKRHRKSLEIQIISCSILLVFATITAFLNLYRLCPSWLNITLACGLTVAAVIVEVLGEYDQNKVYDNYKIPRKTRATRRMPWRQRPS